MAISYRYTNVSEWLDWERPDMTLPYVVSAAPYGESLSLAYATYAEASDAAEQIAGLTGTYLTSWGGQPVNTDVTLIVHFIVKRAGMEDAIAAANATCDRIERKYALPVRGEGETESNLADWELALMVGAQYAEPVPARPEWELSLMYGAYAGQTIDVTRDHAVSVIQDWLCDIERYARGALYGMGPRLSRSTGANWGI